MNIIVIKKCKKSRKSEIEEVEIIRFCNCMEMWRKDMEEDDISNADCDGDCEGCCYCEEIKTDRERMREKTEY